MKDVLLIMLLTTKNMSLHYHSYFTCSCSAILQHMLREDSDTCSFDVYDRLSDFQKEIFK